MQLELWCMLNLGVISSFMVQICHCTCFQPVIGKMFGMYMNSTTYRCVLCEVKAIYIIQKTGIQTLTFNFLHIRDNRLVTMQIL